MPACPLSHKAFATYLLAKGIVSERVTEIGSAKPASPLPDVWISREEGVWLIKILGRKFPSGQKAPQYWRNWMKEDLLKSSLQWERWPGKKFRSLLVFAYEIVGEKSPIEQKLLFSYQGKSFAFVVIPAQVYRQYCKPLSPRWGTVSMSVNDFRKWGRPWEFFWQENQS